MHEYGGGTAGTAVCPACVYYGCFRLHRSLVYPGSRTELRSESQIEPERRGEEPILIDIPKRLEIAVSETKQTTEAVSNRIKKDPSADAIGGRNRPPRAPSIACKCCVQVLPSGGFRCIK